MPACGLAPAGLSRSWSTCSRIARMTEDTALPEPLLNRRYRLDEVVGQGGMAVVWRAEDTLLGRMVAIKVLRDQFASDPEFLSRFRTEARTAAALNDPGVVSVYDVGEDKGVHFLVMEYVPGQDLKQVIRAEAPLDPGRTVRIATALARAVGQAHAIGMVHRDIKPQNVLVTPDGRMKVADFGIARAVASAGMTAPGVVMGTVHYLAPEQASGQTATFASDVYSLGVVMYEMLTGRVPFTAESGVGVALKIINETPVPVDHVNPRVPTALSNIVARAMAREPAARYPTATALAEALEGYLRWSDQHTVPNFRGVDPRRPAAAPPPASEPGSEAHPGPAVPQTAVGPLFDSTGLMLGFVALVALAMLIPLWSVVADRLGAAPVRGPEAGPSGVGTVATGTPTEPPATLVLVPDVSRLTADDAKRRLEAEGLGVTTEDVPDATVEVGRVIRHIPAAGETVPAGTVVNLLVSAEGITVVPDAAGDYQTVADAITRAGLVPGSPRYQWGGTPGQVIQLAPGPGQRMPYGATVEITVGSGSRLAMGVDFDDNVFLSAVDLDRAVFTAGETVTLVPHWEAVGPIAGEYGARAVLRAADGIVISQDENPALGGDGRSTTAWAAGESLAGQPLDLPIPPSTPAGSYSLWVDVFRIGNPGERLPVRGGGAARVADNQAEVLAIEIKTADAPVP
ncbi:Stk1 family PASTA domain-containing Ser/Thr kinase [bacterium]|nr:MAG: Stk1 family PASTA domain-containing Ser/Thr kinase [bacterium]